MTKKLKLLVLAFWGFLGLHTFFSYTLVDPNLVLSSNKWLWGIQQWLWQIGYHQRLALTLGYLVIIAGLFSVYGFLLIELFKVRSIKMFLIPIIGSVIILMFSYPALSHDIFNYVMNAKMVWFYQANPHVRVALDFPGDPLLWYMHNTHTPAPYGYGFTLFSLVPSYLGQNNLKLTILLFRVMMVLALAGVAWLQRQQATGKERLLIIAFLLNPLVLIETVGNIHNDMIMMFLALSALYLVKRGWGVKKNYWLLLAAGVVFLLSVSVKYATIMMVPGLIGYIVARRYRRPISLGGALAGAMFMPLLTARSQRFLPWYLIWPLSFLPKIKEKELIITLLAFSVSAMLSYIPFLISGTYTQEVQILRQLIVFMPPLACLLALIWQRWVKQKNATG